IPGSERAQSGRKRILPSQRPRRYRLRSLQCTSSMKREHERLATMKSLIFAALALGLLSTAADAQSRMTYGMYLGSCNTSSFAICRYRANLRRNGEYTYRRAHNGNPSPAYQRSLAQQRATRPCTPATVWKDACG